MRDHLTESEKKGARLMGITEAEMFERLNNLEDDHVFKVTIVIPVYNGEKFIRECVESALRQTEKDIEIIVIDDGSTDGTLKIIQEIKDITVLIQSNGGTSSALNTGIRQARGKWIHWLSADDVLYPTAIEDMMKIIETIPNNQKYIYYTNYDIIDADSIIIGEFIESLDRNMRSKEERFNELLGNYYGNGSTTLIHKSVFEKIKYDESLRYGEDYDFMLHAFKEGYDMFLIPIKTLKYRRHVEQMTNKVDWSLNSVIRSRYA